MVADCSFYMKNIDKVRTFWEAHKIWKNLPHGLYIYLVNDQTMGKIAQIFVCFSESLNFKTNLSVEFIHIRPESKIR